MSANDLLSRDEVLGGFPAQRAKTLLFLIETRAAQLADRQSRELQRFRSEDLEQERELAFFEAFAQGTAPPVKVRIQQIERHAGQWRNLVPERVRARAAVAHELAAKYRFTHSEVPQIREALGLDDETVAAAYERMFRVPIASIYAERPTLASRIRWQSERLGRRLEALPPFWAAFSLTLTETVGVGILGLPMALAGVGPYAGMLFLAIFGIVNVITIAAMAEAVTRTGSVRYGNAYFGRMVEEYMGRAGSLMVSGTLGIICFLVLICFYIGFSSAMAGATGVPKTIWAIVMLGIGLYYTSRGSLKTTVGSALMIGAVNLILIATLIALSLPHVSAEMLSHVNVPFVGGRPFDRAVLGLLFGVVLSAYFGHLSVGTCGKYVLRREPSGRALVRGTAVAQIVAMSIYCIWVFAINGSLPSNVLAGHSGTALEPLAVVVGPAIPLVGGIFVVLGMGMGSVHYSLGLFNMVRERLPVVEQPLLALARGQGRVILRPRGRKRKSGMVTISYHGLHERAPRFRVDLLTPTVTRRWLVEGNVTIAIAEMIAGPLGNTVPSPTLALDVVDVRENVARVRLETSWTVRYEAEWQTEGLQFSALLDLSDDERAIMDWLIREGDASAASITGSLRMSVTSASTALEMLETKGAIERVAATPDAFRARLGRTAGKRLPASVWESLRDASEEETTPNAPSASSSLLPRGRFGRYAISVLPMLVVFLLVQYLLLTNRESFAGALSFLGVIAVPVFAGIFPALLMVSSRAKGDVLPGFVLRGIGPIVATILFVLFLGSILIHGLFVWEDALLRLLALAASAVTAIVAAQILRGGALQPRLVVNLRHDQEQGRDATIELIRAGKPAQGEIRITSGGATESVRASSLSIPHLERVSNVWVSVDTAGSRQLRTNVVRIDAAGTTHALSSKIEATSGTVQEEITITGGDGEWTLPIDGTHCDVEISLPERTLEPAAT